MGLLFSSAKAAVKATMTKKSDGFSDVLTTDAGGLAMSIFSSRAIKFNTQKGAPTKVSKKYMHLNIKFDQGLPKGANGVFTELAGNKVLSRRRGRFSCRLDLRSLRTGSRRTARAPSWSSEDDRPSPGQGGNAWFAQLGPRARAYSLG